jgi:lipopolysaccharide transport protein LptA
MKIFLSYVIALLLTLNSAGAAGKKTEVIEIEADHLQFNERAGVNFYSGNVRMSQSGLLLHAEELRIYSQQNVVQHLIANSKKKSGQLPGDKKPRVEFRYKSVDGKEVIAYAATLHLFEKESRLLLEGDAELTQGSNHIRSQRIEYNLKNQALIAGSNKNDPNPATPARVRMTITPDKKAPNNNAP